MLPCNNVPDTFLQQSYRLIQVGYNIDDMAARCSAEQHPRWMAEKGFCPSPADKAPMLFTAFWLWSLLVSAEQEPHTDTGSDLLCQDWCS